MHNRLDVDDRQHFLLKAAGVDALDLGWFGGLFAARLSDPGIPVESIPIDGVRRVALRNRLLAIGGARGVLALELHNP